jgi:hypothetical protein
MSGQADLFERAAECERLMDAASDPDRKESLKQLRDMWIALANENATMPTEFLAKQIAELEKLQLGLSS